MSISWSSKGGKFNRSCVTTEIYRELTGAEAPVLVVTTPEEVDRYRDTHFVKGCQRVAGRHKDALVTASIEPAATRLENRRRGRCGAKLSRKS